MSGQLLKRCAKDPVAKHTHVTLTFTQGGQLRFVDPRTFGEMFVSDPDHLAEDAPSSPTWGSTRSTSRCPGSTSGGCSSPSR